mmetsp:Transcript_19628/g.46163  ORF Transcript_19628/g.46163 Transcript_19628/m.46163 type:complete len:96 (+) Transcript_19628:10-297(+)
MDCRVLAALRKLDMKLDRLDRLTNAVHEQLVEVDVKLDALLLEDVEDSEESESSSKTIGSSSTGSEESGDSDMSFVVDDHSSTRPARFRRRRWWG